MRWAVQSVTSVVRSRARLFGGGGTTTSTTTPSPWSGAQPSIMQGLQGASDLYQRGGPSYFPDSTYANPTQGQLQGLQSTVEAGMNGTQPQQQGQAALGNILSPGFFGSNPGNSTLANAAGGGMNVNNPTLNWFANGNSASAQNPFFQNMASSTIANVMPQLQAPFAAGNRMDSGLASRAAGAGLGSAIGNLAYNNYQQGLNQQLQAGGMQADVQGSNANRALAGATGLSGNYNTQAGQQLQGIGQAPNYNSMMFGNLAQATNAGQQQQGLNQNLITDAMNRWNFQQQQPYQNLSNFIGNVQGNGVGQYASSQQQQPYFNNPMGNILGGTMALGGLNNAGMFGSSGLAGLFGGGGGASSLASQVSDPSAMTALMNMGFFQG